MFESKEYISQKVDAGVRLLASYERGDIVPHAVIAPAIIADAGTSFYYYIIGRVRKVVRRDRGLELFPEPGVGYKVVTVQEQLVNVPEHRYRRAKKQINRAGQAIDAIPDADMTDHQRLVREANQRRVASDRRQLGQSIRVQRTLLRQPVA